MAAFSSSDDLQGARFVETNLQGARFVGADLSRVVMRGVQVEEADIDAPWLPESAYFRVNGVDVIPYVEAELDRRFPGRADRRADDPEACARPGPSSRAPGRPPSTARPRCRPARWTSPWTASGRSRRRCATWSWPPTPGCGEGCWRSSSRTTRSA